MECVKYKDIFDEKLAQGAILNELMDGFKEDYLCLHILLKKYGCNFKSFLEIGTNVGTGTKIIRNALGNHCYVYSLDLPAELAHISKQHPISEGKGDVVGKACDLIYNQLWGDSMKYDYSMLYPIDGWFIDGEHDYQHPRHETAEAIKSETKLIVWHDADMISVNDAINDSFQWNNDYILYRIYDTRIAFAVRK